MRKGRVYGTVVALCLMAGWADRAPADPRAIPSETLPDPWGVNIHYTAGAPGETAMLARAFRVVRMDFVWGATERTRGVYDFTAYDGLLKELDARNLTPLFILDYGNDIYQKGPPRTPEARAAYARWAAAAAARYRGRAIMWEFWNEPNIHPFWTNPPRPDEYALLVNEAAPAMRRADPNCTLLVGAVAGFAWDWIEAVLGDGVLQWADAFTVHPYRGGPPETVTRDYAQLRRLLRKYSPDRDIPILSGEWGYSTGTVAGVPEDRQAQYLVRQRLINASQGIRAGVWYDWKNDGPDATDNEHRFGTVTQTLEPKPSYTAAVLQTEAMAGYRFARLLVSKPDEFVALFRNGAGDTMIVLWTTGQTRAFRVEAPIQRILRMDGREESGSEAESTVIYFNGAAKYVMLGRSPRMDAKTLWWWMKPNTVVEAGPRIQTPGVTVKNTTGAARRYTLEVSVDGGNHDLMNGATFIVRPGRSATVPVAIRVSRRDPEALLRVWLRSAPLDNGAAIGPVEDRGAIPLTVSNPITVEPGTASADGVNVTLESPMGGSDPLTITLTDTAGLHGARSITVSLKSGEERRAVRVPVDGADAEYTYGIRVTDASGRLAAEAPPMRFQTFLPRGGAPYGTPSGLSVSGEGAEGLGGDASLKMVSDAQRGTVAELRADFPEGWKYFVVKPAQTAIPPDAAAVGMWVKGDGSGDFLRCRFVDAKGQWYQPTYGKVNWTGWRWITMPLDDPSVGSWGGPQDGAIHQPIRWDSVFLLDSADRGAHLATVRFDSLTLLLKPG